MIVGTAGHVDHGKTTLVRALTGVDADRLPEEKRRGMTIDLGYAYAGDLGFVDVPGHERLVHTMLAGAGGIDAALLVVAADDGVMPQAREHAAILSLLGIDRGVVAITRIDRAPDQVEHVAAAVAVLLADTTLAGAAAIPVCAPTGEGIAELRAHLLALGPRGRDTDGYPRLAVDRAFTVTGAGLIVTGTLVAGEIAVEDRLVVSPGGAEVRVRGLHAQNRPAMRATAGQRVALNLTGIGKDDVTRGDWVVAAELHAPTALLDLRVAWLADTPSLRAGLPVHAHIGAAHVTGRVWPLDAGGFVRLALDRPVGALADDRVVLRDAAASRTLGGGRVIDPWPPRRGGRTPARLARLAGLDAPAHDALRADIASGFSDFSVFVRARNLRPVQAEATLAAACGVRLGPFALSADGTERLRTAILARLELHHTETPDEPGLQPDRLRAALAERPPPALFAAALQSALRDGAVCKDGPWLRLPSHRVALSPAQERIWAAARGMIAADPHRPPRTREIAAALQVAEPEARTALRRAARAGLLIEVAHDHFFLRETLAEMIAAAASLAADGFVATAAFRDRLGVGRKLAIQILECFDRLGVTRRAGEARILRRNHAAMFVAAPLSGDS